MAPPDESFPVPLTPFPGEAAHQEEVRRAEACKKAAAGYCLPPCEVLHDGGGWLAVLKPPRAYVDNVAASHGASAVHRLDRDTSGVLLLSRSPASLHFLSSLFASHGTIAKLYIGLAAPREGWAPPPGGRVLVGSGHGRARSGLWAAYPLADVGRQLPCGGGRVKLAETELAFVLGDENIRNCSEVLVIARPRTGRTHQIRLHCALHGCPLVGDVRYGWTEHREGASVFGEEGGAVLLHAAAIWLPRSAAGDCLVADNGVGGRSTADGEAASDFLHIAAPLPPWISRASPAQQCAALAAMTTDLKFFGDGAVDDDAT